MMDKIDQQISGLSEMPRFDFRDLSPRRYSLVDLTQKKIMQ